MLINMSCGQGWALNPPEVALSADAEILQDEPYADVVFRIRQAECARSQTPNKISGEHPLRLAVALV